MNTDAYSDDNQLYDVVMNDEEQYSIWPTTRPLPLGWYRTGFQGRRSECLDHIDATWTDITPKSVRHQG